MRFPYAALVVVVLILALCTCGCTQLVPSKPRVTPSVTRQQSQPTPFPTLPPRFGPPTMTWYLVSFHDGNSSDPVIPNTTITAFFDGQGTISGTSGCNRYTATYTENQELLNISPAASTKMYCGSPEGVMTQETFYLARIREAEAYSVDGVLKLLNSHGEVILSYTRIPPGTPVPAPLVGTSWYVNRFVDDSGMIRTPRGLTTIQLVFGEDGNLYGNAGCNYYLGSYQQNGEHSVVIGDQKTTRIYCGIAGVMELEHAYLITLQRMTRYSISGDTLILSDTEGKLRIEYDTNPLLLE